MFISIGMLALLGGSGAAALYVGSADSLMTPAEESPIGGACTTIQTLVLKTPAKRLWLRKFIRMDHADGPMRIKTALRVAGLLANANSVDLVQVSVLDALGPERRSEMRGRAIGAEVVIGLQPKYLPDMKEPFIVRYYEGLPNAEGRYYGARVSLDAPEIRKLMGDMKTVPDKEDCAEPEKPEGASADNAHGKKDEAGKKNEHGATVVSGHGEKPAEQGDAAKTEGHETPADAAAKAEGHEPAAAKEQSFLDSVLALVGLGASAEKAPEGHEAKAAEDASHAVAEDPVDAAPGAEDHAAEPGAHDEQAVPIKEGEAIESHLPVKADEHGAAAKPEDAGETHDEAKADAPAAHAAEEHEAAPAEANGD